MLKINIYLSFNIYKYEIVAQLLFLGSEAQEKEGILSVLSVVFFFFTPPLFLNN